VEIYLSRQEIRRRVHARLGFVTNDAQAPQVLEQHNELIRAAALEVAQACPWVSTKREAFLDVEIDQRYLTYPTGCGPGSIIQLGVWDEGEGRYAALRRGVIPVELDDEPLVEEGEPASVSGRGRPILYEVRDQIELYPRADQAYEVKLDYVISLDLAADDTVSNVDAEAVILASIAEVYAFQQDVAQARFFREKLDERIRKLAQGQRHNLKVSRRTSYQRRVQGGTSPLGDYEPNSGSWPSVMPS
jgi:hypothetical protein